MEGESELECRHVVLGFGFCVLLILPMPMNCRTPLGKPNQALYAHRTIQGNGKRTAEQTLWLGESNREI